MSQWSWAGRRCSQTRVITITVPSRPGRAANTPSLATSQGVASVLNAGKAPQTILALSKGDLVKPEVYERYIVNRVLTGAAELKIPGGGFAACVATRCRDQKESAEGSGALPPENKSLLEDSDADEVRRLARVCGRRGAG